MALNWEKMFRRYVHDEDKTPYFTAAARLNKRQARSEVFIYALFLGLVFAFVGVAALAGRLPHGEAVAVPLYAFCTVWMAIVFGWSKNQMAGAACAVAPIAVTVYFMTYGFPPKFGTNDKILVAIILLNWMLYSWRIVRIAQHFEDMPEPSTPPKPIRRNPFDMLK